MGKFSNAMFSFLVLFCSGYVVASFGLNWTFLPRLQELCPYSSFCEKNATLQFVPKDDTERPCCDSCSCQPGCEIRGNCCYDSTIRSGDKHLVRKCTSAIMSKENRKQINNILAPLSNYMMIHSCYKRPYEGCQGNRTELNQVEPVVSQTTGEIYVNKHCAWCYNMYEIVPWNLAVVCPENKRAYNLGTLKLPLVDNIGSMGCYMSYVPPSDIDVESHRCLAEVVRECNASGLVIQPTPSWEYCPMINATFTSAGIVYGNIFCFLCNLGENYPSSHTCDIIGSKHELAKPPFTVVLDGIKIADFEENKTDNAVGICGPTEVLVNSFETECRSFQCPWGQFRIGGKCGFFSTKWTGGHFSAVLKLSPVDRSRKIDRNILSQLAPDLLYNRKTRWLTRNAMELWDIETIYRPSRDGKFIEYFVAFASWPFINANPLQLMITLKQTLKETWVLVAKNQIIRLNVQLYTHQRFMKRPNTFLRAAMGLRIDEEYVYFRFGALKDNIDSFMLPVYAPNYTSTEPVYLNELFLCDQIELRPDEYEMVSNSHLVFKVTNETLYESQFRTSESGNKTICLSRFLQNTGRRSASQLERLMFVGVLFMLLTKMYMNMT